ncbi:MAG: 30S ribosomal protein S8 [Acidimicrobiia bacterium]|nr:30S ribosomal protein S8 [Acidimicrobiia bacterium]
MMTDPIADMLTRIRNAVAVVKSDVTMPNSKMRVSLAKILADEGYVDGYEVIEDGGHAALKVTLRYTPERATVIQGLRRISSPGGRVYRPSTDLPRVQGGLGVAVVSTSQGLMTDRDARREGIGGEIICEVW